MTKQEIEAQNTSYVVTQHDKNSSYIDYLKSLPEAERIKLLSDIAWLLSEEIYRL